MHCLLKTKIKVLETIWMCWNVQLAYAAKEALRTSISHWNKASVEYGRRCSCCAHESTLCYSFKQKQKPFHFSINCQSSQKNNLPWQGRSIFLSSSDTSKQSTATASPCGLCYISPSLLRSPDQWRYLPNGTWTLFFFFHVLKNTQNNFTNENLEYHSREESMRMVNSDQYIAKINWHAKYIHGKPSFQIWWCFI